MRSTKPQKIRNAETDVRKRRRHKSGAVEDIPTCLYQKYVNTAGHIVNVVLDYHPTRRNRNSDYGAIKRQAKHRQGMVPYDECPVLSGFADLFPGEPPCTEFAESQRKRGAGSEDYCCKHVEQLVESRRAEHGKRTAEFARQAAGISEKLREEQREFQAELVNRIEAAMTTSRKATRSGG